jgi:hypothetical protein
MLLTFYSMRERNETFDWRNLDSETLASRRRIARVVCKSAL